MNNSQIKRSNRTIPFLPLKKWIDRRLVKRIMWLGLPLIVGEFGSIAQQFADTMMVGHYGTNELAAAGFVNSIFYFVIFLTLGMSYASTPLVGNAYGRHDYTKLKRILKESLIVNFSVGVSFVLILLFIFFNLKSLFFDAQSGYFHQPLEIYKNARVYLLTLIISVPFLTVFYACKQYLDGIGNTKISMWIMLFSNILNVGLNWCLIFGKFGMPAMGLMGAGISTLISRVLQLLAVGWFVYKTDAVLSTSRKRITPSLRGIVKQIRLGLPISFQLGMEIGIFNICGIFMGWLGALPLAAHQTMYTISTLCFQVLYGIGAAGAIVISQFHGAGKDRRIRKTAHTVFFLGLSLVSIIMLFICLLFEPLAYCFTNDAKVVQMMWLILPSLVLYQIGDCAQITYSNALRGIEDTKPLAYIAFFAYFVIGVPLCYFIAFTLHQGVFGVWLGIPFGLSIAGILFYSRFTKQMRTKKGH